MTNNVPTYDELMSIGDNIPPYSLKCLYDFHLNYKKSKKFNRRILNYLSHRDRNYIEFDEKTKKYVLTLKGKLIIVKKLGINT